MHKSPQNLKNAEATAVVRRQAKKDTVPPNPTSSDQSPNHNGDLGKISRSQLIDKDAVARLSRKRPRALLRCLAVDYGLIVLSVIVSEFYPHPAIYALAVLTIGARLVGIGSIVLHDGVHQLLAKKRRINDFAGRTLCVTVGVPIFEDFYAYRKRHFAHHRSANSDQDPDIGMVDQFYDLPRWKAALLLLYALSGLMFTQVLVGSLVRRWSSNKLLFGLTIGSGIAIAGAAAFDVYPAILFIKYWLIPFATWGLFVNLIRGVAEHYPDGEYERGPDHPEVFRTRDILTNWFDQCFVVTRGLNFHLSHHLVPNVPFYSLADLQKVLATSEPYQIYAHVTKGYHRFFLEYFFQRSRKVGKIQ